MNLLNHPELLERLGAAHALGTLRGPARRRFEAMARNEPRIRAASLVWQGRLSGLVELQPAVEPPPGVWARINEQVRINQHREDAAIAAGAAARAAKPTEVARHTPLPTRATPWSSLQWWRALALGGALAALVLVVVGVEQRQTLEKQLAQLRSESQAQLQRAQAAQAQLANAVRVEYVAVLSDDKSSASVLVTFDPVARRLTLKRIGAYREADDKSLQLWAIAPGSSPRSLGVLGSEPVLRLVAQEQDVSALPTLAISLEPKGGVSGAGGPTGPVLFKGAVLKTPS